MYTIHVDGQLLYSTASEDEKTIVLSPKLSLDINRTGSLSFVLPPGNAMHSSIKKLKSIITVEQDGEQIFRGRVMEDEKDYYNQKNVYCEGDKSFLLDSVFKPGELSGTVHDFFKNLISNHNEQVDETKKFTVGVIDAVNEEIAMNPASRTETRVYWSTLDMIEDSLLNVYGGYLKTRTVGDTHYIDWLAKYGSTNSQPIEFGVNLLDLKDKVDAGDVFTVLIPLGACSIGDDGNYTDPLTVASVNNGLDYIQDDAAVALYGKIWRTHTWSYIEDASQLLEKGREYLKIGAELQTLKLKAVDMHFTDTSIERIRIGDDVQIFSDPHGSNRTIICAQMEIDLLNPENTLYTFGEPPRTLTENVVKAEAEVDSLTGYRGGGGGGGRKSVQEEISDIIRWAYFFKNEQEGQIGMIAGEHDKLEGRVTEAEISIDKGNILLSSVRDTVDEHGNRITEAEASITVNADAITTKVSKDGVISSINQTAESIKIQASKINLSGYVTASTFNAEIASLQDAIAGDVVCSSLTASTLYSPNASLYNNVSILGQAVSWQSKTVISGGTIQTSDFFTVEDVNGTRRTVPTVWSFVRTGAETINYIGR